MIGPDIALFPKMNSACLQHFKQNRPARTTLAMAGLAGKARIEITVTARKQG